MANLSDHVLHSANGRFGAGTDSKPADADRILGLAMSQKPAKGLVLHFHGGLVKKSAGLQVAEKLTPVYEAASAYPVFFVWESGFFEALLNNKDELAHDPAFQELVKKVSEWALKRVGGSVAFKGSGGEPVDVYKLREEYDAWFAEVRPTPPVADHEVSPAQVRTRGADQIALEDLADAIEAGLDDDPDFRRAMEEAYNAQLPPGEVATRGAGSQTRAKVMLLSEQAQAEMFPRAPGVATKGGVLSWLAVAKFVAKMVLGVLGRYRGHRDHGLYCTVVEEVLRGAYGDLIGSGVWNEMKQDTADSFRADPDCCGTAVVQALKRLEDQDKVFSQITLVGHSTGAIYICNFLDAAKAAGLHTPIKVVFLAPALTHTRFAQALREHANTSRMQQFRMFAMSDERECADRMLGVIYTRSLLYFVSGLTEGETQGGEWHAEIDMPIGGMQRYLNEAVFHEASFADIKTVADYLAADPKRTVWSPADGGGGLASDSQHHGDFDDDPATLKSVQAFVAA